MENRDESPGRRLPAWCLGGLILVLLLVAYWPALRGGLVFDDAKYLTAPELRSWTGLARIWSEVGATQQYFPVLHSAFWFEHRLWGDATLGYHLANLLEHAAACWLLAAILGRLWSGSRSGLGAPAAWLAAALFAVHPVCVESVAWISEQKNTLSLLFYLLSALAYLEFDATRRPRAYVLALLGFVLALASKSVTATLPAALLVLLWWRHGSLAWRRDVRPLLPWLLPALGSGLFTVWVERGLIGAQGAGFELPAGGRLLLAGRAIWFYLGKIVWPAGLTFVYPRWDLPAAGIAWWLAPAGAIAVTLLLWAARDARRGLLAGWLIFVGSLFPTLGLFNVYFFVYSYVADHFQYLACPAILAVAAAGWVTLASRASLRLRRAVPLVGVSAVVALAVLTHRQSRNYRDAVTLYRATLAQNPDCWMAHNNLAWELARSSAGVPEALVHYADALRLNPDCAEAHDNLANLLASLPGRAEEAVPHFAAAVRLRPDFIDTRANYANLLMRLPGRLPEAVAEYQAAVRRAPDFAELHFSLANALARTAGGQPQAIAEYQQALRLKPDLVQAHLNLANELAALPGRWPEAQAHYEQALRIDPRLADAHYDLAVHLSDLAGRAAEAQRHYEAALRLRPDYVKAHNNLGVLLAQQGRLAEAERQWQEALRLDPQFADARRNLELLHQHPRP